LKEIGAGGLSGEPVEEISTEVIAYLHQQSKGSIPIIGVGGIHDASIGPAQVQCRCSTAAGV
jgi:dihydroorotate dehydrogenase